MAGREDIAKCLFNTAMVGHANWDDMSEPNKEDWRVKADAWILDVARLKRQRAALTAGDRDA